MTLALILSIAVLPTTVKAQEKNLPSFKNVDVKHKSNFKSPKAVSKNDLTKFIQTVMISGDDSDFPDGFAQAVTLEEPRSAKFAHADISERGDKTDSRECHVVYRSDDTGKHAVCILLSRSKWSKTEMHDKWYRVNLDGALEKAVAIDTGRGPDGNALPEGRSRKEEDVTSADINKAFKTELDYWIMNWAKKHPKGVTKTERPAATPAASPAP